MRIRRATTNIFFGYFQMLLIFYLDEARPCGLCSEEEKEKHEIFMLTIIARIFFSFRASKSAGFVSVCVRTWFSQKFSLVALNSILNLSLTHEAHYSSLFSLLLIIVSCTCVLWFYRFHRKNHFRISLFLEIKSLKRPRYLYACIYGKWNYYHKSDKTERTRLVNHCKHQNK